MTSSPGQLVSSTRTLTSHHCQEPALCALLCTQSFHGQGAHIFLGCFTSHNSVHWTPPVALCPAPILCTTCLQPMSCLLLLMHECSSQLRGPCCGSLVHIHEETLLPRVAPAGCPAAHRQLWLHALVTHTCFSLCVCFASRTLLDSRSQTGHPHCEEICTSRLEYSLLPRAVAASQPAPAL